MDTLNDFKEELIDSVIQQMQKDFADGNTKDTVSLLNNMPPALIYRFLDSDLRKEFDDLVMANS